MGHSPWRYHRDVRELVCAESYPSRAQICCKQVSRIPLGQDAEVVCKVPDHEKLLSVALYSTGISGT